MKVYFPSVMRVHHFGLSRLERLVLLLRAAVLGLSLLALLAWIFSPAKPFDDTDPTSGRSGLRLYVDARTGCHYLGGAFSGITPRVDAEGRHICEPNLQTPDYQENPR